MMRHAKNICAKHLPADWQEENQTQINFSFYQSIDPENFYSFAHEVACELRLPLKLINLTANDAYSPFNATFELLKQGLKGSSLSIEQAVFQATHYQPLQKILIATLKEETYLRSEMLVLDDHFFEKQALSEAIINLIETVLTKPAILVISGWHHASTSAIQLLQKLVSRKLAIPLSIMVSINSQYALTNRQDDEVWEDFLDWLDDTSLLHQVPRSNCTPVFKWQFESNKKPNMQLVKQNSLLMAWPEVKSLTRFLLEEGDLSKAEKTILHLYLAQALLFIGEFNSALNELESLLASQELLDNAYNHIHLLNLQSLTLVQLQNFNEAMLCSEVAQDIAKKTGDGQLLTQSMFINFFVHDRAVTPITLSTFELLYKELQSYKMECSLLYVLRNYYSYLRFYDHLKPDSALNITQQAIKLAKSIGHQQGIAASYHSKGIIYSYLSRYHATFRCFAVSSYIREQLGEATEQVKMHNGTGYFNTLLEQYPQAQTEYLTAYEIARLEGDYSELVVTIYNFSWLYFCTRDYQTAADILNQVVRICRIREMTHFPFRNLHDIFSLKGICHAKLGEIASAKQCLERMQVLPFKPSRTAEFLQALLKGTIYSAANNLLRARKVFEQAPVILGKVVDMNTFLLPQCNSELLEVYSRQGDWSACDSLINSSLIMCETLSLPRFAQTFTAMKAQIQLRQVIYTNKLPVYPLAKISLQLNELIRNAKQVSQLRHVQQRLREMQLISRMQSLPEHFNSRQELTDESLKLLCSNFTVQAGMIHLIKNKQWVLCSKTGKKQINKKITACLSHITKELTPWIENRFCSQGEDGKRATYNSTICLPVFIDQQLHAAITLCNFNRNRYFDNQTIDILQLICRQLGSQLEQLKHQENLLKMSTTDPLTGLFNRQALLTRLEQELLLCRQSSNGHHHCALAYIDLDNFKMVNDKLGHDVGDKLLKQFAKVLTHTMRTEDIVARWGGDEFVVLFPNANHQQAKRTAQRLLSTLHKESFFRRELAMWADKPELLLNLPHLSCSIGISDCTGVTCDKLSDDWLLKQADQALYQAKKEGKGRIRVSI